MFYPGSVTFFLDCIKCVENFVLALKKKKKKTEIEAQDNQEPEELKISRKQGFFIRTCSLDPLP